MIGDHSKSYEWLLQNGIPIYTNDEAEEHFEIVAGEKMIGKPEKIPFDIGSFSVIPFYLPHDGTPNFGFLIEHEEMGRLLYCTVLSIYHTALHHIESIIFLSDVIT